LATGEQQQHGAGGGRGSLVVHTASLRHCRLPTSVSTASSSSSHTHTHTHTHLTALFPGLPGCAGTRKAKPIWILLKQETVSGSGISWAICKSAPRFRQITTPAPHHSVFTGRMSFLPPNQQRQSTEGTRSSIEITIKLVCPMKLIDAGRFSVTARCPSVCLSEPSISSYSKHW